MAMIPPNVDQLDTPGTSKISVDPHSELWR